MAAAAPRVHRQDAIPLHGGWPRGALGPRHRTGPALRTNCDMIEFAVTKTLYYHVHKYIYKYKYKYKHKYKYIYINK